MDFREQSSNNMTKTKEIVFYRPHPKKYTPVNNITRIL